MKWPHKILVAGLFFFSLLNGLYAQQENEKQALNNREQSIIAISAFTAKGDIIKLEKALSAGLDVGLTINEIKEVLVQLYAYAGFPRSLNALNRFMAIVKQRKEKGLMDDPGKEPKPMPVNKTSLVLGTANQTKLVGRPVTGEVYQFAPAIDQFLKAHLFGDIFGRDNLDWKTRELATIAALASLGGAENQLRSHFGVGMYNGLTESQLHQLVSIIRSQVGAKEGGAAKEVLQNVLGQRTNITHTANDVDQQYAEALFPKGEKIANDNFTGTAWLQMLVTNDTTYNTSIGHVTFEPGTRTKWHYHPGGQILLVTNGKGRYQEKGKPVRELRRGDVIKCEPNTIHWHGAAPDSELTHLAIGTNLEKGTVLWQDPVSDEEYNK